MGHMLDKEKSNQIRALVKEFDKYTDKGWMCEGSEYYDNRTNKYKPCNIIFNNNTDECFQAKYDGSLVDEFEARTIISVTRSEMLDMVKIQGKIMLIAES